MVFQEGGFYSAEDADSLPTAESKEKKEGAFCVWTWAELQALLAGKVGAGDDGPTLAEVFCHHYSCREEGNVDPLQVCQSGCSVFLFFRRLNLCVHVYASVRVCTRTHVCICVCTCVCVCVCVHACMYMHAFVSACADMGAYMFVCLWCV